MADVTRPDAETREAEQDEAHAAHSADRPPTAAETEAAEAQGDVDESVARAERDMAKKGANAEGEGRVP
jgi:hypothetical protein